MKKISFFLFVVIALFTASCDNYDTWSTSAGMHLDFSYDKIDFDTCITTVPSSTKTLLVYNNNDEGLRLSRVYLHHGGESIFRVNVDGQYLADGSGSDFEIHGNDSIFVRLEVTVPEAPTDSMMTVTDSLVFLLESGVMQYVPLAVTGENGEFHDSLIIHVDSTLQTVHPIIIRKGLTVEEGTTLTLQPGTRLYFHDQASLTVDGTLESNGTLEKPVILRGDRTDDLFDYLPYDNTPNRWYGVYFTAKSQNNKLTYTDIHSGILGIEADSTDLSLTNCLIYNMGGDGILNFCSDITAVNTQISNCGGVLLDIIGGSTELNFCTLAQFYLYGSLGGDAIYMTDNVADTTYTIRKAMFWNTVVTGYADDVINANLTGQEIQDATRSDILLFHNCFLATVLNDGDARFQNCLLDEKDKKNDPDRLVHEDNFVLFDADNYHYDFTPKKASRIRGLADKTSIAQYPTDRLGHSRDVNGNAYAGAYEGEQN